MHDIQGAYVEQARGNISYRLVTHVRCQDSLSRTTCLYTRPLLHVRHVPQMMSDRCMHSAKATSAYVNQRDAVVRPKIQSVCPGHDLR